MLWREKIWVKVNFSFFHTVWNFCHIFLQILSWKQQLTKELSSKEVITRNIFGETEFYCIKRKWKVFSSKPSNPFCVMKHFSTNYHRSNNFKTSLISVLRIALYYYKTIWEFYVIGNNENKAKYKKKESVTEEEGSS